MVRSKTIKIQPVQTEQELQVGQIKPQRHYKIVETQTSGGYSAKYQVTFRITEACDLKCNYCHWHSGRHYAYEDIIKSIDVLFEFFIKQKISSVVFYYHGGEATRHPKVVDILKYIHDKSKSTGVVAYNEMQTNLTIGTDKLKAILEHCDQFNISYHYLDLKRLNKLDAFERNWNMLKEMNVEIHNFDIMLENVERTHLFHNGNMIDIEPDDFYDRIINYLTYDKIVNSEMIYGFCHYKYPPEVEEKHLNFYKKYNKTEQKYIIDDVEYTTNDLFKLGVDTRGWECQAGQKTITINGDGNVFHCGIQMTNFVKNRANEKPYTNLVTDEQALIKMRVLYQTGTICRWDYCGGDYYIPRTPPNV